MNDIVLNLCNVLKIDPNVTLKKSIRGKLGITVYDLIYSLIANNSVAEAAEFLGYTDNPVKQCIKQVLIPHFPYRHREFGGGYGRECTWRILLLSLIDKKFCNECNNIKHFSEFGTCKKDTTTGLRNICSNCKKLENREYQLFVLERTPSWVDKEKLKRVYYDCPSGMEVDHIIPLRGRLVSGLHVPENLQYLTKSDNARKNNNYIPN